MLALQISWTFCPTATATREGLASSRMVLKKKVIPLAPLLLSSPLSPLM